MPWQKKVYNGSTSDFLDALLVDITAYVTDKTVHGNDAWQLIRQKPWPYGTVFKIPNYQEGEYGYVALMRDNVRVGKSYWEWLKQPDILRKTFVLNKNGLGLDFDTRFGINNGVVTTYTATSHDVLVGYKPPRDPKGEKVFSANYTLVKSNQYRFSPTPEIFAKDADVIFFSMFKQYHEPFDWSELMGNERRSIQIKPLKYYGDGQTYPSFFDPPLYPGTGCPAIGYSPGFFNFTKNECSQDEGETKRTVYLAKDRHRLTVAIHYREHWDTASVGFFEPFDTQSEYAFPAMTVGGTSGVLPLTELCSYGGAPVVEHGFRLDYTESNWSLSHGSAPFSSTWWNGQDKFLDNYMYSQSQAMLPDGNWQSFATLGLRQDVYHNYQMGLYFSGHKEPERIPNARYFLTPTFTDISKTVNLLPTAIQDTVDLEALIDIKNHNVYQLEPLYFVQRTEDNTNQNIIGGIKNIYWCSNPVTRYGEYGIAGKKYLVIPNGWENRKYHIKHYFSALLGEAQTNERQLAEMKRLEMLSQAMNTVIVLD